MKPGLEVQYTSNGQAAGAIVDRARRVPILNSLGAGWVFLFTSLWRMLPRVWVPLALLVGLELIYKNIATHSPLGDVVYMSATFLLYALILSVAYRIALGEKLRPLLAVLRLGGDELRLFAATLVFSIITILMLAGAVLVADSVVVLLFKPGVWEVIIEQSAIEGVRDMQWLDDIRNIEGVSGLVTMSLAVLMLLWFGVRYSLVAAHAIAVRRLAVFEAMAITKHNSWRMFLLLLLVGASFAFVGVAIFALLQMSSFDFVAEIKAPSLGDGGGAGNQAFNPKVKDTAFELPGWVGTALQTSVMLALNLVLVGALANAYQHMTGRARSA